MPRHHTSAVACLLVTLTACTSMQDDFSKQLLRPPASWLVEPAELGLPAERFEIVLHSDASLTGWWIPTAESDGRTVVLLHEEATNVSAQHPYYTFLHEAGFNVLTFDPRGFGQSVGTPTLRAWLYDLRAVFEWLHTREDVDQDRIALFGTSLGSVAAMWAARMHRECKAIVFEHLPSLRDMLRETVADPDSAVGAYSVGLMEFTGLPENFEAADNAPRVQARALFVATENELARNRKSLLRSYDAYGGEKVLWVVPEAAQAPHAMLTHGTDYQRVITTFLRDALDGRPLAMSPSVRKVRDASDGEAWYDIQLAAARGAGAEPWAVEACAILDDGSPRFARVWVDGATNSVRMKLPKSPTHVGAIRLFDVERDDTAVFVRKMTHLSRSGAAVAPLWPAIERVRNERASNADLRALAADLEQAASAEPFHAVVEAELSDVYAAIGLALDDKTWLRRAVVAAPQDPARHFWPGPVPTYGFPQWEMVQKAIARLGQ